MKGWRTIIFNFVTGLIALLGVTGVIEATEAPDASVINGILDHVEAIMALVNPIGNVILRKLTTGPLGTKV
jgi:hypothetical protein